MQQNVKTLIDAIHERFGTVSRTKSICSRVSLNFSSSLDANELAALLTKVKGAKDIRELQIELFDQVVFNDDEEGNKKRATALDKLNKAKKALVSLAVDEYNMPKKTAMGMVEAIQYLGPSLHKHLAVEPIVHTACCAKDIYEEIGQVMPYLLEDADFVSIVSILGSTHREAFDCNLFNGFFYNNRISVAGYSFLYDDPEEYDNKLKVEFFCNLRHYEIFMRTYCSLVNQYRTQTDKDYSGNPLEPGNRTYPIFVDAAWKAVLRAEFSNLGMVVSEEKIALTVKHCRHFDISFTIGYWAALLTDEGTADSTQFAPVGEYTWERFLKEISIQDDVNFSSFHSLKDVRAFKKHFWGECFDNSIIELEEQFKIAEGGKLW